MSLSVCYCLLLLKCASSVDINGIKLIKILVVWHPTVHNILLSGGLLFLYIQMYLLYLFSKGSFKRKVKVEN